MVTITGANDFARQQALRTLVEAFVAQHGDMAVERLDGEETTTDRLRESVESLPFLTTRKLVILRGPSKQKLFTENIGSILEAVAETTDLIIVEPKLDKRSVYYKTLRQQTDFRDFPELDGQNVAKWVTTYTKEQGRTITAADARFLVDRVGVNQRLLQSEIDKLAYISPNITRQTIEALTEPTPQSTVFELLDAAFSGNPARALELYREQRALKVEPLAIMAMLVWQMHIITVVKAAGTQGSDEIARAAKLSPFVVRKTQQITRKLTSKQIKTLVRDLLALDIRLKTTAIDTDEAVEHYLLKIAL